MELTKKEKAEVYNRKVEFMRTAISDGGTIQSLSIFFQQEIQELARLLILEKIETVYTDRVYANEYIERMKIYKQEFIEERKRTGWNKEKIEFFFNVTGTFRWGTKAVSLEKHKIMLEDKLKEKLGTMDGLIEAATQLEEIQKAFYARNRYYLNDAYDYKYSVVTEWLLKFKNLLIGISLSTKAMLAFESVKKRTEEIVYGLRFYYDKGLQTNTVFRYLESECLWLDEDLRLDCWVRNEDYIISLLSRYKEESKDLYTKIFHYKKNREPFELNLCKFRMNLIEKIMEDREEMCGEEAEVCVYIWKVHAEYILSQPWYPLRLQELCERYGVAKKEISVNETYRKLTNRYIIERLGLSEEEQDRYGIHERK